MQLADLNINNSFSSYSVVHQTLVNEEERCWKRQYSTVIWNKNETALNGYAKWITASEPTKVPKIL